MHRSEIDIEEGLQVTMVIHIIAATHWPQSVITRLYCPIIEMELLNNSQNQEAGYSA